MNLCKKCTAKSSSFLFIDTFLAQHNPSHFIKNVLEKTVKLIMAIYDKTRN